MNNLVLSIAKNRDIYTIQIIDETIHFQTETEVTVLNEDTLSNAFEYFGSQYWKINSEKILENL